jgi:hypothetical protein
MKKLLSLGLVLILSAGFFTGCKKEKENPPALPSQASMTIDFSNFDSKKKSADLKGTETSNWEFARNVAIIWKSIITTTLAVPVASFINAAGQTPVFLSDKTWQWSYNYTVLNVIYKARLTGQVGATNVSWKMYITQEGTGGFPEFTWFEGTSSSDDTSGQWIFNYNPADPVAYLQIDWTKTGSSIGSIKYTYIKNDSFKNSYIVYGLTSAALNAYYTINYYNGSKFSDVNVEWNTTTRNGHVKSVDYMGDNNWYCWDSNKINVICP